MTEKTELGKKPVRFGITEGALLGAALLAAALFRAFHAGNSFYFPGLGLTVTQWGLMGAVLALKKREGKLTFRGKGPGMLLLALALLLGLCYALYFDQSLRVLNFPVVVFLSFQALRALCGGEGAPLSLPGLTQGFLGLIRGLFLHLPLPIRAAVSRVNGKKAGAFLLGVAVMIPVMAVVVLLLSSGDSVFGGWLARLLKDGSGLDAWLCHGLVVLAVGLPAFSALLYALREEKMAAAPAARALPPASFLALLIAMAVVYTLFAGVQIRYLFAGEASVWAQGGYAQYARSGFFQLTAVAFITLLAVGAALSLAGSSRAVRILCLAVAALTLVIDFSAFFRMRLYIREYGLSMLRLLTLWAMAMIALCLIGVMGKSIRPGKKICGALCGAVLCAWVALNLINPGLLIAKYNVNAYRAGALPRLDVGYLSGLMPDAKAALALLEDPLLCAEAESAASALPPPSLYDASLTALTAKE